MVIKKEAFMQDNDAKVIVALDYDNEKSALDFVNKVDPKLCKLKVGKELFTSAGPQFVEKLVNKDYQVFLDLKFHDIPNTVAKALKASANLGVWLVNVHCMGGYKMLQEAASALSNINNRPLLIGVTVLTSMDAAQLTSIGINRDLQEQVLALARLANDSGLDGVVCSAQEARLIKDNTRSDFLTVTPGIRPLDSAQGDQIRVMTPAKAILNGADYLVIGRPITQSLDPITSLIKINEEISAAKL